MKTLLSKYFVGETIISPRVLARVQEFSDSAAELLNVNYSRVEEVHLTIIPPFFADYLTASLINLAFASATIRSSHPLTTTWFSIRGMEIMSFDGIDVLHFPVTAHKEAPLGKRFKEYVLAVRAKVPSLDIALKEPIPEDFTAHITALSGKNLRGNAGLQELIAESSTRRRIVFRSAFPSLYARYGGEWRDLSHDPSTTDPFG